MPQGSIVGTDVTALIKPSESGLAIPDDLLFEDWERLGERIANTARNLQWFWGDWLNYGEKRYGEKYREVVEKFGLKLATAQQYAWVAREYETCERTQLPWSHFKVAAGIADETERTELLQQAVENKWSVARLRQEIKADEVEREESKPKEPEELMSLVEDVRAVCRKWRERFGDDRLDSLAALLQQEADTTKEWLNGRS